MIHIIDTIVIIILIIGLLKSINDKKEKRVIGFIAMLIGYTILRFFTK